MDGLVLVNKSRDITSHDVVLEVRKILLHQKIGHFGTLDPLATGLLLVAVGKATKFFPYFSKMDKVYEGRIKLGLSTDTYDSRGEPTSPESREYPDLEKIQKAMKRLEGEMEQVPPLYSAKKFKGKPLYKLARRKQEIKLHPSKILIHFFRLKKYFPPFLDFEVKCSSGTYIRSLANDIGQLLGCGAHLSELVRTEVGNFKLKESFSVKKIKNLFEQEKIHDFLIPLEFFLPQFPRIVIRDSGSFLIRNGNAIFPEHIFKIWPAEAPDSSFSAGKETVFRLFDQRGRFLALARPGPQLSSFVPFLVVS